MPIAMDKYLGKLKIEVDFESEDNKCNLTGSTSLLQVDISGSSDSSYSLWGGSASVVTLSTSPASSDKRCQLCGQKYHLSWDQPWQQNLCSRCREGPETIKDRILKVVDSIHDSQYRPNVCSPENFKGSPLKPDAHNTCTCRDEVVAYCHDCNKLLCPWCFEMHQDNSSYEKRAPTPIGKPRDGASATHGESRDDTS